MYNCYSLYYKVRFSTLPTNPYTYKAYTTHIPKYIDNTYRSKSVPSKLTNKVWKAPKRGGGGVSLSEWVVFNAAFNRFLVISQRVILKCEDNPMQVMRRTYRVNGAALNLSSLAWDMFKNAPGTKCLVIVQNEKRGRQRLFNKLESLWPPAFWWGRHPGRQSLNVQTINGAY